MTLKYRVSEPALLGQERTYVIDALEKVQLSSGEYTDAFEAELARVCGTEFAVTASNGTAALHLALAALGVGPDDEVIVPALTFIATANAVSYTGARVVLADSDETWCVDPRAVRQNLTQRTSVVLPVHVYGQPADMDTLDALGVPLVDDAAEAFGADYRGWPVGALGDATCFSFHGSKALVCGEGGAVTTNSPLLAERMRFLRGHAMSQDRRYWHEEIGFNYRLSNIQAAIGLGQLQDYKKHLTARRRVAAAYACHLPGAFRMQPSVSGTASSRWMTAVECDEWIDVPVLRALLEKSGVETRPVFPPISLQPAYAHLGYRKGEFPVAERLHKHGLILPTHFWLMDEDVEEICAILKRSI